MIKGTYDIYIEGYDWGCGVYKTKLTLEKAIASIQKEDIKVLETKQITNFTKENFPIEIKTFSRTITDAYLVNEKNEFTTQPSKYIMIEMYVSPEVGSPLLFSMHTGYNTWSDPYYLTFVSKTYDFEINQNYINKYTTASSFKLSSFTSSDHITYQYASYTPQTKTDKLVVWLHGMGEGGTKNTDPYITILANKVTSLAQSRFQEIMGTAHILAPQCPTFWMDEKGTGGLHALNNTGPSFYTTSLMELIEMYKTQCGAKKVYLCGCSNGGFMTMRMGINYPHYFNCLVPICEALKDEYIKDEELLQLKDQPLYFIYATNDPIVDPKVYEIPTIKRLKEIKASQLNVSTTKEVIDLSRLYKTRDHLPYAYSGHWSWIYFFNNESFEDTTKQDCWSWMSQF